MAASKSLRDKLSALSFHGVKHLTSPHVWDRRWWSVVLCSVYVGALWVFVAMLARYHAAPTMLAVTAQQRVRLAAPAVALCPETNFPQERVDAFLKSIKLPANVTEKSMRGRVRQLAAFTDPDVAFHTNVLKQLEDVLHYNALTVLQATRALLPTCDDMILRCRWRGQVVDCGELFSMSMTGDGYCCSFNGRSVYGKQKAKVLMVYANGANSGLEMVVSHRNELPTSIDLGYKWLVIQDSSSYNEVKSNGTAISAGYEYFFGHLAQRLTSSEEARRLSRTLRQCLEQNENPLKYFPEYDRKYCLVECEMEASLRRCGCAKATHPAPPGMPLCTARSLRCATTAVASTSSSCDCPSACEHATSHVTREQLRLVAPHLVADCFYDGVEPGTMSIVRVYVTDTRVVETRRECYFTFFNLISQLGGIFSVYMGCSFISGVEVLFLTWRGCRELAAVPAQRGRLSDRKRKRLRSNAASKIGFSI